ncbi:MAG: NADH-quinone oxidoreductase subunit N, partial [Geobacteraceae bacterium]|nr:NADH-quinone oxidoreductase subunit N [Geobacteraceae bacterium]
MTVPDIYALIPLMILAGGSVLVLLAGAIRPGGYLYGLAGALIAAAMLWSQLIPAEAVMPGLAITPSSRFFALLVNAAGLIVLLLASGYNRR